VAASGQSLSIEGPKGKATLTVHQLIKAKVDGATLRFERSDDEKQTKALHGLWRALAANYVLGVTNGFSKELEINGVGYRAAVQGQQLVLTVGYSHPVNMPIPKGLTVEVPKPTNVVVKGVDKQLVGEFAAQVRRVAPPEPYKGKGIRYAGEQIRRKAGKAATGSGAKAA